MTKRRKAEIEKVQQEGRAACMAGKHRQTNPYPTGSMNRYQWFRGYSQAEVTIERPENWHLRILRNFVE